MRLASNVCWRQPRAVLWPAEISSTRCCLLRHGDLKLFRTDPHSQFINKGNPWSSITWGNAPSRTLHLKSPSSHLVGNFSTKGFRLLFIQSQSRVSQNHFCFNTAAEFSRESPRLSPTHIYKLQSLNCFISSRRNFFGEFSNSIQIVV